MPLLPRSTVPSHWMLLHWSMLLMFLTFQPCPFLLFLHRPPKRLLHLPLLLPSRPISIFSFSFVSLPYFLAQSLTFPCSTSSPCGKVSKINSNSSRTAFGLPGILMMSVFFRITLVALDNIARFVILIL